jgi:hypothetical protein
VHADTRLVVVEDEQPDRRRQVAELSLGIDRRDEVREGYTAALRDLLETPPECIFEADACLVAGDDD